MMTFARGLSKTGKNKGQNLRSCRAAAIAEFGAAFMVLVVFLFIPLVNMSFVGVRFFIAHGAVQEFAHRLALSEKRSEAYTALASDTWWQDFCSKCGVTLSEPKLELIVCAADSSDKLSLTAAEKVPVPWLPGGNKGPCVYALDLSVDVMVPPIYNGGGPAIPGLTQAIPFTLKGKSAWENLSRNPISKEYFINE